MARERGNGTGSVTVFTDKKGRKRYRVRVSLGVYYDEEAGKNKTITKSLGVVKTKAEAEALLAEYNNSPYDLTTKIKTVGDLYEAWFEGYSEKLTKSAVRTVASAWNYCSSIKNMPLRKLGAGHIQDLMDNCYIIVPSGDDKGKKRYASVGTKMRIKSLFNLMLDYAVARKLVVSNVARAFEVNDMRKEAEYQKKIKEPFSQEEIDILWENLDELPFVDMILIGIYSGFRPSELCQIKVENVDLENDVIIGGMKTEAGKNRVVPIHPLIKPLVEKRYIQATERLKSEWLFNDRFSQTGYHLTYDKYRGRYNNTLKALNIKGKTGHCTRVTFITKCYKAEIPEYIIKRIVGHSLSGNVTDYVYNRVTVEELVSWVQKIEK